MYFVDVRHRVEVNKQARLVRTYSCRRCGAQAKVGFMAFGRGTGESTYHRRGVSKRALEEADELAMAALQDDAQATLDLLPCPRCKALPDEASLYRQNTILAVSGAVAVGLVVGGIVCFSNKGELMGLVPHGAIGVAFAVMIWVRRKAKIDSVRQTVEFLPDDAEASASPKHPAGASSTRSSRLPG